MTTQFHLSEFASKIEVIYTTEEFQPDGTVKELNGHSADINSTFKGSFVWLKVHRAEHPGELISKILIDISSDEQPDRQNLAKGTGGDYRYLRWALDPHALEFMTDVYLWRCDDEQTNPPPTFDDMSTDINKGRVGAFLYLIWRIKLLES